MNVKIFRLIIKKKKDFDHYSNDVEKKIKFGFQIFPMHRSCLMEPIIDSDVRDGLTLLKITNAVDLL